MFFDNFLANFAKNFYKKILEKSLIKFFYREVKIQRQIADNSFLYSRENALKTTLD
jgi:hypothetical protein